MKSVGYPKAWHIPEEWNLQQNLFCWKGVWQWRVICKENWNNSTKNISMGLHEVKWEEEKITNFTLLKLCTHNWRTECTKGSGFLSCSKEYLWKFAKQNCVWGWKVCIKENISSRNSKFRLDIPQTDMEIQMYEQMNKLMN